MATALTSNGTPPRSGRNMRFDSRRCRRNRRRDRCSLSTPAICYAHRPAGRIWSAPEEKKKNKPERRGLAINRALPAVISERTYPWAVGKRLSRSVPPNSGPRPRREGGNVGAQPGEHAVADRGYCGRRTERRGGEIRRSLCPPCSWECLCRYWLRTGGEAARPLVNTSCGRNWPPP